MIRDRYIFARLDTRSKRSIRPHFIVKTFPFHTSAPVSVCHPCKSNLFEALAHLFTCPQTPQILQQCHQRNNPQKTNANPQKTNANPQLPVLVNKTPLHLLLPTKPPLLVPVFPRLGPPLTRRPISPVPTPTLPTKPLGAPQCLVRVLLFVQGDIAHLVRHIPFLAKTTPLPE
jgi:hypothetical protein